MAKDYSFTKTLILGGLQCRKKLWFDLHDKIKPKDKALFHGGNRFNEVVRKHYGRGLDLSGIHNYKLALAKTKEAIKSNNVNVIYEGAFQYLETYIRSDVLIKKNNQWTMLEAKASTGVKDINVYDVAIQSYIVKNSGLDVTCNKLIHINKDFIYQGDHDYSQLIVEQDLTDEILIKEKEIEDLINNFKPLLTSSCPSIQVGKHCESPYPCQYLERCSPPDTDIKNVSYKILPYVGKKLESYCSENNIEKLKDIPKEYLLNSRKGYADDFHYIIQQAHTANTPWINQNLKENIKDWVWPYYFMDFETVQQTVPIIKNTRPFEQFPFQWSIHKWPELDKPIEDFWFLDFYSQNIEFNFLKKLVETLGDKGTIFVHNHPFEKGVLNRLKEKQEFRSFATSIDNIIDRIVDTLELTRMHFYSPAMFGQYSLKSIVKGIPTQVSYEASDNDTVKDGSDAQLAWFKYTDPSSKEAEKQKYKDELIKYCAKDTYAMYDLIQYFLK